MIKKSGADKRKGKLNNAGFSLVEVLVAMAVLAILSIPVLGSFSNAARINHKARKEENANTVASDIVEQFKSVSMRPHNCGQGVTVLWRKDSTTSSSSLLS